MTGRILATRAHAKINVFLRVLGRRADGFHDVETLILPLDLHDLITAASAPTLTVYVTGDQAGEVPAGEGNLVARAAHALADAAGLAEAAPGAAIEIHKRVPVAAGMGGGSADAAATLGVLNELWETGLDEGALLEVAASIGSDVPALVTGRPVFASGRGEHLVPLNLPLSWWVIRPFPFGVPTSEAYAWWGEYGATGPDPGVSVAAAESGNVEVLGRAIYNDLQDPVCARHPEIAAVVAAFERSGALGAVMTGSGPTVAALARDSGHAHRLAELIEGSIVASGPPLAAGPFPKAG